MIMATSKIKNTNLFAQTFSKSVTIAGNTNTQAKIPITVPAGYSPVMSSDISLPTQFCTVFGSWLDDNYVIVNIRSNRSDAITGNVSVKVLFMPI